MRVFDSITTLLIATTAIHAQPPTPLKLQWKVGHVHTYAVKQTTKKVKWEWIAMGCIVSICRFDRW